jgi:predicted phage terminase large subunit-like protein
MTQQPQMTRSDWIAMEREMARRSLASFAQMAWPILEPSTELKWGWSLDAICEHLEGISRGELRRLLINVPPGCMKSLLTNVIWPAWEWGPAGMPFLRHIGTAHKQDLAIRDSLKCRRLIQSKWYQERWPISLVSDQNAKTKFENDKTGFMESMSFTGMTGSRGDRIRLDDPISADAANSEAELNSADLTFSEALPTRVNNSQSAIVVIMQRLHERDTSGLILSRGLGYTHLCLPMRYEPSRKCTTQFFTDPRTEEGELLFPERFPEEQVQELEKALGSHATAGQLQQRPAPRGGGILKTSWFKYWKSLPQLEWRTIFVDTAMKTGEKNDYSVFQCWGRSTTGQAVLLDLIRGKWEAPELLVQARAFWSKHLYVQDGAALNAMRVEDKVSGTGLIQTLRREGLPIVPIQRSRDKISRAHDAAPFIESGNVLLPENAPWLADFLKEVEAFPTGANDDQIDPMLDAIKQVQVAPAYRNVIEFETHARAALGSNRRY